MLEIAPGLAVQVTAVLVVPVTVAVNCCVPPDATVALVGEMETAVGLKPVPASATVLEIPAAVTVSVPVALPDATGANITQTLQWVLGAMTPFQVEVGEQSVLATAKGPEGVMALTERPVVPVFVTQTLLAALVVPTAIEPKERLVGDSENELDGGGVIVTEAVADLVASATLVAVTVAVVLALTVGAV